MVVSGIWVDCVEKLNQIRNRNGIRPTLLTASIHPAFLLGRQCIGFGTRRRSVRGCLLVGRICLRFQLAPVSIFHGLGLRSPRSWSRLVRKHEIEEDKYLRREHCEAGTMDGPWDGITKVLGECEWRERVTGREGENPATDASIYIKKNLWRLNLLAQLLVCIDFKSRTLTSSPL